jgi:glutamine phosphoribosylpyrophosphate amidotransferase
MCGISLIFNNYFNNNIFYDLLLSLYQIKHRGLNGIGITLFNNYDLKIYKLINNHEKCPFQKLYNTYYNKNLLFSNSIMV